MKHVVLLGAGRQHLDVVRDIAAAPFASARVTWVVPQARHVHAGRLPDWVGGHATLDELALPLAPLARRAGVEVVEARVDQVDTDQRCIVLGPGQTLGYDVLGIDAEATVPRDVMAGAREHALFVRPNEGFIALWGAVLDLAAQRPLNVVVVGGDPMAAALAMAVAQRLGERSRVAFVTGGEPLAVGPPRLQARLREALRRLNVTVFDDVCTEVRAGQVQLRQGMRLACDAPLIAARPQAPTWLAASGLALDAHGLAMTAPTAQSVSHPEVFVVGALAGTRAKGLTQAGHIAKAAKADKHASLALNLRRGVAGGALVPVPEPVPRWQVLTCGDRHAIACLGGWCVEGGWVWALKARREQVFLTRFADPPPA